MSEILTIEDCLQEKNEVKTEDYYSIGKEIYDKFDEYSKKKGHGYSIKEYPIFWLTPPLVVIEIVASRP